MKDEILQKYFAFGTDFVCIFFEYTIVLFSLLLISSCVDKEIIEKYIVCNILVWTYASLEDGNFNLSCWCGIDELFKQKNCLESNERGLIYHGVVEYVGSVSCLDGSGVTRAFRWVWRNVISYFLCLFHYSDIIMSAIMSQITSISIVCSAFCSGEHQRKHQSSAPLAFVRGIHQWLVDSPHKGPVTWKMFPFDDVILYLTPWKAVSHLIRTYTIFK